jgi:GH43 family beta-xylosidase
MLLLAACSDPGTGPDPIIERPACTFTNPVAQGADPWVVRQGGSYYLAQSTGQGIYIYRSDKLTEIKKNGVLVWTPPATGWNRANVWAPELHFIDGRWYIYYAAGEAGPPFIHQRSGVLQSVGEDPQGQYTDMGMLYTGDEFATKTNNKWAIDLTVSRIGDQLYAVWSGWEENQLTDRTPQHLYIARMSNPWTISSNRVKLSSPTASWERGSVLDLQEGPQFLKRGDQVFIIYSTRESWMEHYRMGQLRLRSPTTSAMNPDSAIKSGPVFAGTGGVYGAGHASFTTSPDDTEDWVVYHSKTTAAPGWEDRVIRMQKFTWNGDNSPNFGTPVATAQYIAAPSGECARP